MGVAGLAAPAKDFKRLDHAVTISTGRAGFAPDTIAPSARAVSTPRPSGGAVTVAGATISARSELAPTRVTVMPLLAIS